jgi:hypothetical protein
MPAVQGRVLEEGLQGGPPGTEYAVMNKTRRSSTKIGLTVKLPTDLDGRTISPTLTRYSVELKTKILTRVHAQSSSSFIAVAAHFLALGSGYIDDDRCRAHREISSAPVLGDGTPKFPAAGQQRSERRLGPTLTGA